MTHEQVRTRLNAVFRDIFDDETINVTDAMTAKDIEGWDSLTHVNLVVAVEKAFAVSFTTKEISGLANVGDFIGLIVRKTP
jgi:acyl carrier protein